MKKLEKKIRELEKRIEMLEKSGGNKRLRDIADWLIELFEDEDELEVRDIMVAGVEEGYSEQMIGRARRSCLSEDIVPIVGKGRVWKWKKMT